MTFRASNGVTVDLVGERLHTEDRNPAPRGSLHVTRVERYLDPREIDALREYFRSEPKPWHDAKPDDVWILKSDIGREAPWTLSLATRRFDTPNSHHSIDPKDDRIVGGRRIWPEVSDGD